MAERLPDDKAAEICRLHSSGMSKTDIARTMKLNRCTIQKILKRYGTTSEQVGPPPNSLGTTVDVAETTAVVSSVSMDKPLTVAEQMERSGLDPRVWIPQYHKAKDWQGFYALKTGAGHVKVDMHGRSLSCKRVIAEEVEQAILAFTREHVGPIDPACLDSKFEPGDNRFMVSWGIWDAHIGMYAWSSEVGENFDLTMATNRILNSIDDIALELKPYGIRKILMPIGNDFMHFDNVRHKTTFGEHFLDTDSRYGKVYHAALKCLCYMVETALNIADEVEILYIPGNHDLTSSYTLCVALSQRYRMIKRAKFDLSANPRKYRLEGGVLMCYDHGCDIKPERYPLIFSTEAKAEWSKSTYREVQIGHTHQRRERDYAGVVPTNGLIVRTNPSLANVDAWHHRQGMIGEPMKSVEAWRYDEIAYRGSHVAWARDDESSPGHKLEI